MRALRWSTLGLLSALSAAVGVTARADDDAYGGVSPETNKIPENLAAAPGEAALVTWPGFQMLPNGGSRVFIQTSVAVQPTVRREGTHLEIFLPTVSLPPGNARLPLDTSFFNSPVSEVHAKRKKGGVVVSVVLRSDVAPEVRTERAETGYFFVLIEFPPGTYR